MTHPPGFPAKREVDLLLGRGGAYIERLELDVPNHPVALEHDVVASGVDLRPQDFDSLLEPEPRLLEEFRDEDVLHQLLVECGAEESLFFLGLGHGLASAEEREF